MSVNQTHATLPGFDRTALRVNQAAMIVLLLVAFVANLPWLAAITAIIMALGAYPNNPAARKAIKPQAKWRKAR